MFSVREHQPNSFSRSSIRSHRDGCVCVCVEARENPMPGRHGSMDGKKREKERATRKKIIYIERENTMISLYYVLLLYLSKFYTSNMFLCSRQKKECYISQASSR